MVYDVNENGYLSLISYSSMIRMTSYSLIKGVKNSGKPKLCWNLYY